MYSSTRKKTSKKLVFELLLDRSETWSRVELGRRRWLMWRRLRRRRLLLLLLLLEFSTSGRHLPGDPPGRYRRRRYRRLFAAAAAGAAAVVLLQLPESQLADLAPGRTEARFRFLGRRFGRLRFRFGFLESGQRPVLGLLVGGVLVSFDLRPHLTQTARVLDGNDVGNVVVGVNYVVANLPAQRNIKKQ